MKIKTNCRIQNKLLAAQFFILIFFFVTICFVSKAGQESAFVLSGNFQDVFADKHSNGGSFTVQAFESNALVDMTFENGWRQVVGTDGHDSFVYNAIGQAIISYGRFPSDAHEFQQFLWLVCVHDPELITNLHNYGFRFYGAYTTNDIVLQIITNNVPPNQITSIKWYAPNFIIEGTNHYKLSEYTNGYLRAELVVTRTSLINDEAITSELEFTQYQTRPPDPEVISNLIKRISVKIPMRSPNDVVPIEFTLFSMTNIQIASPLSSYIPMILDKTARVNDKRNPQMGIVKVVSSGKWWTAQELYKKRYELIEPRREVILFFLFISSLFPIFLLIRMWITRGKNK